jgi:hypothetical protein
MFRIDVIKGFLGFKGCLGRRRKIETLRPRKRRTFRYQGAIRWMTAQHLLDGKS